MAGMVGVKRPRDDENEYLDAYIAGVTDTEVIISNTIRESFVSAPANIIHGMFLHQLYASVTNKTAIDVEVSDLRSRGVMKVLQTNCRLQSSSSSALMQECSFILPATSYFTDIEHRSTSNESMKRFLPVARRFCSQIQILESELKSICNSSNSSSSNSSSNSNSTSLTDRDLVEIQHYGFLLRKGSLGSDNVYAFSHPGLRALQQIMDASRTKLLSHIKKTRFKELSEVALAGKPLGSWHPSAWKYHLTDAMGLGLVEKVPSSRNNNTFYRIVTTPAATPSLT